MTTPNALLLSDWISLAALLALLLVVAALVAYSRLPRLVKLLIYAGLGLRVIGAAVRYRVLWDFYGGVGDARGYYGKGVAIADLFRQGDFSSFAAWWSAGNHMGTETIRVISGIVLTFVGHSFFTEFVVFSLFAFVGLVGFAVAFHRSYPASKITGYLALIWLFPSLWYWPSSVGKEAVVLMGIGLAVMGFIGNRNRVKWLLMGLGIFVVFAVRPELAGVLLVSMMMAHWLSFRGGWRPRRVVQGVFLLTIGVFGLVYTMRTMGIEGWDVEEVVSYAEEDKAREVTRGTNVEPVSVSLSGIPTAAFNVLFRPLPWEAKNLMILLSSFEIMAVWFLVVLKRKNLMRSLRNWRSDRFISLSIAFILFYSIALGLMMINLGIIARQRIFLFPFLFLLLEARPRAQSEEPRPRTKAVPRIRRERRLPAGVSG